MRQLRVLIEHLPPTAATARAHRGHGWVDANYQLADVADLLNNLVAVTVAANSKDGRVQPPKPYPRPDVLAEQTERREKSSMAAIAHIESYRARREA